MLPTASVVSRVNNRLSGEHELRQTESHIDSSKVISSFLRDSLPTLAN